MYPASSIKTFEVEETELVNLAPETEDPDQDVVVYSFTEPLSENGEWQTSYGDAGEYDVVITVSDGVNEVSEEILIIVNRKEETPSIDSFNPREENVIIDEGDNIKFMVEVSDLNNDELSYTWKINDEVVSNNKEILFTTGYNDSGKHLVSIEVSDGKLNTKKGWDVEIVDVDVNTILEQIKDVRVLETKTVRLELPDFKEYGLKYAISEPLGDDNRWETTYDDAGEYKVTIKVEGKDFEGEKKVKVFVKNKDRAPKFVGLRGVSVKENEILNIELEAIDADGDKVHFSAEDVPEGAEFVDNVFVWKPNYDFVKKEKALDHVVDEFGILSKSVDVVFVAQSNELKDKENVRINVKNANRPFVLEDIEDIEVDEGEEISFDPKYNDPDNDKVGFSYSGFMGKNKKMTGFDDAGEYVVKIVGRDRTFTQTKLVKVVVNDINRKPVFGRLGDREVLEGNELRIELRGSDEDGDELSYSAVSLPKDAKLRGNVFTWKPDFDVVFNGTEKKFGIEFVVDDGVEEDQQKVIFTVFNKNMAPKINDFSDNLIVLKDELTLFEVDAVDGDGDELKYEWDFGFLEKIENDENKHQRTFTTEGSKKVKVTVSDGKEKVSKVWNVEVV